MVLITDGKKVKATRVEGFISYSVKFFEALWFAYLN